MKIGPTYDFDDGKLGPDDEGGLNIGLGIKDGKVVIAFGKSVAWIAMSPDSAIELSRLIARQALEAKAIEEENGDEV